MNEQSALLRVENLSVRRQNLARPAIDDISFAVEQGGTLTLLGEAGSGKEAVLRFLAGASEREESGSAAITLRDGSKRTMTQRDVVGLRTTFLPGPHALSLNAQASVLSQLSLVVARKLRQPQSSAATEIELALKRLPNSPALEALDRPPSQLSSEMLAAALLAAALAQAPELLLADDPLSALSPSQARRFASAIQAEQKRSGFALLYAAGNAEAVTLLGSNLIVLRNGHVVEEGPASRLATTQSHAYTQALFHATSVSNKMPVSRSGPRGEPLLQVQNLRLPSQSKARESLTFELRRGSSLALLGEQGSGRHALVRVLIGLDKPASGRIVFDQVDIGILSDAMMSRLRRRVAFITGQDDALDPRMTIFDTVEEPLRAHISMPRDQVARNRDAALKRVGLAALPGNRPVAGLSRFDLRRLQIARAIVGAPHLAVIDEPLRGLDGFAQSVLRDLLHSFRANERPAFLVITSDFGLAQGFCEDVFVFRDGRVVERGAISAMLREPQDSHTKKLIDAVAAAPPSGLPPEPVGG